MPCARISTAPVLKLGFSVPGGRGRTRPFTSKTYSLRTRSATLKLAGVLGVKDDLYEPLAVAKIDKYHTAVVTPMVHHPQTSTSLSICATFNCPQ